MPPSLYKIKRSDDAKRDLAEIRTYTIRAFGPDQWPVYKSRINAAIRTVASDPLLHGKPCGDIKSGYYRYHMGKPKGRHYLYFSVEENTVVIDRILYDGRHQGGAFNE